MTPVSADAVLGVGAAIVVALGGGLVQLGRLAGKVDETTKAIAKLPCIAEAHEIADHGERLSRIEGRLNGPSPKVIS